MNVEQFISTTIGKVYDNAYVYALLVSNKVYGKKL